MDEQTTTHHATDSIRLTLLLPVSPERLYAAWLDSREHSRFTGARATIEPTIGGRHTAWDEYITGQTLELVPGRRIVQTWRSLEFPEEAGDSRLEISFEAEGEGTRLTILHTGIPEGEGAKYEEGWEESYFAPMRKYFAPDVTAKPAARAPAPKKTSTRHAKAKRAAKRARSARRKKPAKPARKARAKSRSKPPRATRSSRRARAARPKRRARPGRRPRRRG